MEKPDYLITAQPASLFPILSDTNRERRITSIFLAVLCHVPDLAEVVFQTVGVRVGTRTKLRGFAEVVFRMDPGGKNRPDGLLIVNQGKTTWSALIETKIGRQEVDEDQVKRYLSLAKDNDIDAVITISNQFVARSDHSPVSVPKTMLRKTRLYHWSWPWLATQCEILSHQKSIEDDDQRFLADQFLGFLMHPATGVERFSQMPSTWKDVVQDVTNGTKLRKTAPEVEETVAAWFAEIRDLSLHLSSNIGAHVRTKIEKKLVEDPSARLKIGISELVDNELLTATLQVPNAASDIRVEAALGPRTVAVGMFLKARLDRKSTKARLNWIIGMVQSNDERIHVRAHWPGRAAPTMKAIKELRENPECIQSENPDAVPHGFEVLLIERTGKRFSGRKTFIEDIERIVPEFYEFVGVGMRAWLPSPPKPRKPKGDDDAQLDEKVEISDSAEIVVEHHSENT